ncbi:MAG: LLM class flavin-dependent oxidoreductase [Dehalococcoidia bacterium]|nr:LLM class flavin-dependent oxidoreductase [Dehalococcoidia bacterium]
MPQEVSVAFQTDKTPQQYVALAQQVDEYDLDAVTVYCDAPYHPSYGPLLLMALHIHRARLGPACIPPSRIHPIDLAVESALLEGLAPDRTYLGLARGAWLPQHGIAEHQPPIQAIREAVEIVRLLLSGGDELKVGGSANPDLVPVIRSYLAQGEARASRVQGAVGIAVGAVCVCDEDRDAARGTARRSMAIYLPVIALLDPTLDIDPELMRRLDELTSRHQAEDAGRLVSDDLLERFAFAGNADDLIRQAEALYAAGATRVEFGTPHGLEHPETGLRLIGERVVPALRSGGR